MFECEDSKTYCYNCAVAEYQAEMIQAKTNKREFYKNKWIERVPAVQRVSQ
jgi:uncharacterized protein YecA (UPF0149 family)